MTLYSITTGALFKGPEQRVSKAGKPFWTATLKCRDGDATQWIKIVVFSETIGSELMRLQDGDGLSAQGALSVSTYERNGETKIGFSLLADHILALRQPRRPKSETKKTTAKPGVSAGSDNHVSADRRRQASSESGYHGTDAPKHHGCDGSDPFDDAVPF